MEDVSVVTPRCERQQKQVNVMNCRLTAAVGNVPAAKRLPLPPVQQTWAFHEQRGGEQVARHRGQDVQGGAHLPYTHTHTRNDPFFFFFGLRDININIFVNVPRGYFSSEAPRGRRRGTNPKT